MVSVPHGRDAVRLRLASFEGRGTDRMMVVFMYSENKPREVLLANAFIAGLKVHGIDAMKVALSAKHSVPTDADIVCMFGVKSKELWRRYRKTGIHILYFDKGYTRSGNY